MFVFGALNAIRIILFRRLGCGLVNFSRARNGPVLADQQARGTPDVDHRAAPSAWFKTKASRTPASPYCRIHGRYSRYGRRAPGIAGRSVLAFRHSDDQRGQLIPHFDLA